MLKSGLILTFGNTFGAVLLLVRNILVARLVSVEDFGIASTFAITLALLEMITNFALDRLIVQARDGEHEKLQSTLHSLQVARGAIASLVLFVVAHPIAVLFAVPEATWAYQVMAIVPFLRGFAHLDIFRLQRELKFGKFVMANLVGQLVSTVAVWPLALWLGDYRIMLAAILLHQILYVLATHVVAHRPYLLAWEREIVGRALSFGLPLLANGCLLFGIFHGDRIIVANQLGAEVLGWFSVAFTLTLMPSMLLAKTANGMLLPILSKANDGPDFEVLARATLQSALVIGLALAVGFFLLGGPILVLLFGEKYAMATDVVVWLALMQALRLAKAGPAIVAMSRAETKNPMYTNIVRICFLPVAFYVATINDDIRFIVWIAMGGEALGFLVSLMLLKGKHLLPSRGYTFPILAFSMMLATLGAMQASGFREEIGLMEQLFGGSVLLILCLALTYYSMSDMRRWILRKF